MKMLTEFNQWICHLQLRDSQANIISLKVGYTNNLQTWPTGKVCKVT